MANTAEAPEHALQGRIERLAALVATAREKGADAADAVGRWGASTAVTARKGKVEESSRAETEDIGLRVFVGRQVAIVSSNGETDGDAGETLVERAIAMARAAPEDPYARLATAEEFAATLNGALDLHDATDLSAEALTERALAADAATTAVEGVSAPGGSGARQTVSHGALVTSDGFAQGYSTSMHSLWASAIAGTGTEMVRDYDHRGTRHLADLVTPEAIGTLAG